MSASKGLLFLLQVLDGTYQTIGGLQATSFSLNAEEIDITSYDDNYWKTLLDEAGIRSVALSGNGVHKNGAPIEKVRANALSGTLTGFKIIDGNNDYWTGSFKITAFELSGETSGALMYSISLVSSGEVSYTAA